MSSKPASDLLYDSEAALRLVDSALESIHEPDQGAQAPDENMRHLFAPLTEGPMGLLGLSQILARGYAEIVSVLGSLRESRSLLERTAVDRIQHTHAKLREVSSTTETAATSILDGLERCLAMVDRLDEPGATESDSSAVRTELRDELFSLINHLQFHDITTQQINYASSVLTDTEERLSHLAAVLDPNAFGVKEAGSALANESPAHFDPAASVKNAEERQAVADEVFTKGTTRL